MGQTVNETVIIEIESTLLYTAIQLRPYIIAIILACLLCRVPYIKHFTWRSNIQPCKEYVWIDEPFDKRILLRGEAIQVALKRYSEFSLSQ